MTKRLRGYRILIVEDEYFIANDLESGLRMEGAEVLGPVPLESEASRIVAREAFDAAVLDVKLPDATAYSIADRLTERNIPFVFATGYGREAIPHRFHSVPRWEKPYDLPNAISDICRLCRQRGGRANVSRRTGTGTD